MGALVEHYAGIDRHDFKRDGATDGAGQAGLQYGNQIGHENTPTLVRDR